MLNKNLLRERERKIQKEQIARSYRKKWERENVIIRIIKFMHSSVEYLYVWIICT